MAQPAPASFRLNKHQTAQALAALEVRKFGHRLNAEELAQKANVDLDSVNRIELQLPIENGIIAERIANALSITPDLLRKISGLADLTPKEWQAFQNCVAASPNDQRPSEQCERVGLRPIYR